MQQNLVATFCPIYPCEKGTKCGNQVLSKIFVLCVLSLIFKKQIHNESKIGVVVSWQKLGIILVIKLFKIDVIGTILVK